MSGRSGTVTGNGCNARICKRSVVGVGDNSESEVEVTHADISSTHDIVLWGPGAGRTEKLSSLSASVKTRGDAADSAAGGSGGPAPNKRTRK